MWNNRSHGVKGETIHWGWGLHTGAKVRLAASTQDGIKLRLVGSSFIFPGSIQFLSAAHTKKHTYIIHGTGLDSLITSHHSKPVPERPVWPWRRRQSPFRHDFPGKRKGVLGLWIHSWEQSKPESSPNQVNLPDTLFRCKTCSSYLTQRDEESAEVTRGVAGDGVLKGLPVLWKERRGSFFFILHTFAWYLHFVMTLHVI